MTRDKEGLSKNKSNRPIQIFSFVDRAPRYNRVKKSQFDAQLILSTLHHLLAYLGPSLGGTTLCIQQLVLIILFR
jgi:hypothetical protein